MQRHFKREIIFFCMLYSSSIDTELHREIYWAVGNKQRCWGLHNQSRTNPWRGAACTSSMLNTVQWWMIAPEGKQSMKDAYIHKHKAVPRGSTWEGRVEDVFSCCFLLSLPHQHTLLVWETQAAVAWNGLVGSGYLWEKGWWVSWDLGLFLRKCKLNWITNLRLRFWMEA